MADARKRASGKFWFSGTMVISLIVSIFHPALATPANEGGPTISDGKVSSSSGGYDFKRSERCFMRRINRQRARYGLNRLEADKQLGYVARRHASDMANAGGVWHDGEVGRKVTRWIRIGQNTGKGRGCRGLSTAFWNSSGHQANILGQFRFIGVGTSWRGGRLYVQQLFEARDNPGNVWHYP